MRRYKGIVTLVDSVYSHEDVHGENRLLWCRVKITTKADQMCHSTSTRSFLYTIKTVLSVSVSCWQSVNLV